MVYEEEKYEWSKEFPINKDQLDEWKQDTKKRSLLQWAIDTKIIAPDKFRNWASKYYGLPKLSSKFLNDKIDRNLLKQYKSLIELQVIPIRKYEDILYAACIEPIKNLPVQEKVQFLIADAKFMKDTLEKIKYNLENTDTNTDEITNNKTDTIIKHTVVPPEGLITSGQTNSIDNGQKKIKAPQLLDIPEGLLIENESKTIRQINKSDKPAPEQLDMEALKKIKPLKEDKIFVSNKDVEKKKLNKKPISIKPVKQTNKDHSQPNVDTEPVALKAISKQKEHNKTNESDLNSKLSKLKKLKPSKVSDTKTKGNDVISSEKLDQQSNVTSYKKIIDSNKSKKISLDTPKGTEAKHQKTIETKPVLSPIDKKIDKVTNTNLGQNNKLPKTLKITKAPVLQKEVVDIKPDVSLKNRKVDEVVSTNLPETPDTVVKRKELYTGVQKVVQKVNIDSCNVRNPDILKNALQKLDDTFNYKSLFIIKDNTLVPVCWDSSLKPIHTEPKITLEKPSIFRVAFRTKDKYFGEIYKNKINDLYFDNWMLGKYPNQITVLALTDSTDTIGMFVGVRTISKITLQDLDMIAKEISTELTQSLKLAKSA